MPDEPPVTSATFFTRASIRVANRKVKRFQPRICTRGIREGSSSPPEGGGVTVAALSSPSRNYDSTGGYRHQADRPRRVRWLRRQVLRRPARGAVEGLRAGRGRGSA